MAHVIVTHTVKDYAAWKPVFDGDAERRRSGGSKGAQVYRSAADPNQVTVVLEFSDAGAARAFASDPALKAAMERAGVVGAPDVRFVDFVERQAS